MSTINLKSKVAIAALAGLLISLPIDEGGVTDKGAVPYKDVGGLLTVCYGHTGKNIEDRRYTKDECLAFLKADTERHMKKVLSCMTNTPTEGQLKAFTSMDFNTGSWCSSRSAREFNKGNYTESCKALAFSPSGSPAWSYVGGKFYPGLHARRKREMNECLS